MPVNWLLLSIKMRTFTKLSILVKFQLLLNYRRPTKLKNCYYRQAFCQQTTLFQNSICVKFKLNTGLETLVK